MERENRTTKGVNTILYAVIFLVFLVITVISASTGNDGVFAPMLMVDQIFLMVWIFKPGKTDNRTAYYAIIAFGVIIGVLSLFLSFFGPSLGESLGWESHPDDANGVLYPAVNDGRENCYFASFAFLCYYISWIANWFTERRKINRTKNINSFQQ